MFFLCLWRRAILSTLLILLAACAQLPTPSTREVGSTIPGSFSLEGRLLIKQDKRADTVHLNWTHNSGQDSLELASPLGQILAQIESTPAGAQWRDAQGRVRHAANAQALLAQFTDVEVPLNELADWVRAQPSAEARVFERDTQQRVRYFADKGWFVRIDSYSASHPTAIQASRGDVEIRLAIESWQ